MPIIITMYTMGIADIFASAGFVFCPVATSNPTSPCPSDQWKSCLSLRRVLFHPMGANDKYDPRLSNQRSQQRQSALVSTKEAFGFFCLLTKETRRQALALRNVRELKKYNSLPSEVGTLS